MNSYILTTILFFIIVICLLGKDAVNADGEKFHDIELENAIYNHQIHNAEEDALFHEFEQYQIRKNKTEKEKTKNWQLYLSSPYCDVKMMPPNPGFYKQPIYRKPYRWPFTFSSSYPIKHNTSYSI